MVSSGFEPTGFASKVSEIVLREVYESHFVANLLDADHLASEHGGYIGRLQFVRNKATARDVGRPITDWIIEIAQSFIRSGRFCIEPGWITHTERLVWSLAVNADSKVAETRLLLQEFFG